MEQITGPIKIRDILLDKCNWLKVFLKHSHLMRKSIIINVLKVLSCKTTFLGYTVLSCLKCSYEKKVPHTCKSRFCSSCGKKATDNWIKTKFNTLPKTKWQHITFTMPSRLWELYWYNRHLLNKFAPLAADIIKKHAAKKDFLPGIFLAIHTSGRDLKRNAHIHLTTTLGGLCISNKYQSWISGAFFPHKILKRKWKYNICHLLYEEYKQGNLILPRSLKHIKTASAFYSWLQISYKQNWVVHLQKPSKKIKNTIDYIGKYLKRPPIGETKIKKYDGKNVTFEFLDHYTKSKSFMTLPVLDFIERLITHIPDCNFRTIRYYGFLANKNSSKLLPVVYKLLKMSKTITYKIYISWRNMIKKTFSFDPGCCPHCKTLLMLSYSVFPRHNILEKQKEISHGFFPIIS